METTKKTVGYILMLDVSASIYQVLEQIKIDAKAFICLSRKNDQFGVNCFNDSAHWVYPQGQAPAIATVSKSYFSPEILAACQEIDKLQSQGCTNIDAAIVLGNQMIQKACTGVKAFVLLSDGNYNTGPAPESHLGAEPPVYVAGLGPELRKSYFEGILKKNPQSRYYHRPSAVEMMMVFYEIRGIMPNTTLLVNQKEEYQGTGRKETEFTVFSSGNDVQVALVWSDKRFLYTPEEAEGYRLHVDLLSPDGRISEVKPVVNAQGYCIFHLQDALPGVWKLRTDYRLTEACICNVGVFQLGTPLQADIEMPNVLSPGEPLHYKLHLPNQTNFKGAEEVVAKIIKPVYEANDTVTSEGCPVQPLSSREAGTYEGCFEHTEQAGSYTVQMTVKGICPDSGYPFCLSLSRSVLVG